MAIWQFKVDLVPRVYIADKAGILSRNFTEEDVLAGHLWRGRGVDYGLLDAVLPEVKSWSPEVRIWGVDESDKVVLTFDGAEVEWITCYIDMRKEDQIFASRVVELAEKLDCVFFVGGAFFMPSGRDLEAIADSSIAAQFVRNPERTLKSLKRYGGDGDEE
jgi:hypothetical protein